MKGEMNYHCSADECGWRRYPAAGEIRIEVREPHYYPQADLMEKLSNYNFGTLYVTNRHAEVSHDPR